MRIFVGKNPPYAAYEEAAQRTILREKDKAIAELNRAYENRESQILYLKTDMRLDPLRDDPRFKALLTRVGFST